MTRFFDDVLATIQRLSSKENKITGFYEETKSVSSVEWSIETAEALQTSAVMVAMLSPAYVRDERAGREWQIFEMRKRLPPVASGPTKDSTEKRARAITPVTWIPWQGRAPRVIRNTPIYWGDPNGVYIRRAILGMLKSITIPKGHRSQSQLSVVAPLAGDKTAEEYRNFVTSLAEHIIETAEPPYLPPLDFLPTFSEIENIFLQIDEPKRSSEAGQGIADKYKLFVINGEFVKTLAGQINETTDRVSSVSLADLVKTSADTRPENRKQKCQTARREKPYTVFLIGDEEERLEVIEETCLTFGHFQVKIHKDPKETLDDIEKLPPNAMPDLFVVDLELKHEEINGFKLIEELCKRTNNRSAIMAMSRHLSSDELMNATVDTGAVAALAKTFSADDVKRMRRWAELGRNLRLHRADPDREPRPIFLSYSGLDVKPPNFLRRNLEFEGIDVWYAEDMIKPGQDWRKRIRNGLANAHIFVALITENYPKSPRCRTELILFLDRLEPEVEPPLLIPVLYEYSLDAAKRDEHLKLCLNNHCIETSAKRLLDGFSTLLVRSQNVLSQVSKSQSTDL